MKIDLRCPQCSQLYNVEEHLAASAITCPKCKQGTLVQRVMPPPVQLVQAVAVEPPTKDVSSELPPQKGESRPKQSHYTASILIGGLCVLSLTVIVASTIAFFIGQNSLDSADSVALQVAESRHDDEQVESPDRETTGNLRAKSGATEPQPNTTVAGEDQSGAASKVGEPEGRPAKAEVVNGSQERVAHDPLPAASQRQTDVAEPSSPDGPAPTAKNNSQDNNENVAAFSSSAQKPPSNMVEFDQLVLDEPVTCMEMTEDGKYIVFTHQAANRVSFYDVLQKRVVNSVTTPSPRAVLCRNGKAFVGNYGEGTISVFSRVDGWLLENELLVDEPGIVHIDAPGTEYFEGMLVVTCHGEGRQASYHDCSIFMVNVQEDKNWKVAEEPLASWSYDGRIVITQDSFNLSPSGQIHAFNAEHFSNQANRDREELFQGGVQQTPFVYQVSTGSYWLAHEMVLGGAPVKLIQEDLKLLVPDLSQRVVYVLSENVISARKLNSAMTEIAKKRVQFRPGIDEFDEAFRYLFRARDYLVDHPLGFTHGGVLNLFAIDATNGVVWHAETEAFLANELEPSSLEGDTDQRVSRASTLSSSTGEMKEIFRSFPRYLVAQRTAVHLLKLPRGAQVELMAPHRGMSLSAEGKFHWTPEERDVGIHELKVRVRQKGSYSVYRKSVEVVDAELAKEFGDDLTQLSNYSKLELTQDDLHICTNFQAGHHVVLQGNELLAIGGNGIELIGRRKLPNRYKFIGEREDYWVAVTTSPAPALDILHKSNLSVLKHVELEPVGMQIADVTDIALHPQTAESFVAIKRRAGDLPRSVVLLVDEARGNVRSTGIPGTWIKVTANGENLYSGYKDLYRSGTGFHLNPDWRIIDIPRYGNIDMLINWRLRRRVEPEQILLEAGGNGHGIRMSPDGRRVTYLSFAGYPVGSNKIVGLVGQDFEKGVSYDLPKAPEGDERKSTDLTYHPRLPVVAIASGQSCYLFHRETGKLLTQGLLMTSTGLSDLTVEAIHFSPDGGSLLLVCNHLDQGRFLRSIRLSKRILKLQPLPKLETKKKGIDPVARQPVPRSELQALIPQRSTEKLDAREIGRKFLNAVVMVQSGRSVGTGFVVGRNGFILTAAHVIDDPSDVRLLLSRKNSESEATSEAKATVMRMDERLDLALLKVTTDKPLTHVHLAANLSPETGEVVTVIGNPTLGASVLSKTMTTGIVSNPSREIDGIIYLQTSAAVNPGNSGGPMFNDRGEVIGLVTLKAEIDGTAFALPAGALNDFLIRAGQR